VDTLRLTLTNNGLDITAKYSLSTDFLSIEQSGRKSIVLHKEHMSQSSFCAWASLEVFSDVVRVMP
jgi:hypothetical protein